MEPEDEAVLRWAHAVSAARRLPPSRIKPDLRVLPENAVLALLHGTTLHRAKSLRRGVPDPLYTDACEGHVVSSDEGVFFYLITGPFAYDPPEEYARRHALRCPEQGGPAVLEVDVPYPIIELALMPRALMLRDGCIQFNTGAGLEELVAAWPGLTKRITVPED